MTDWIDSLDDATAVRVLKTYAGVRREQVAEVPEAPAELAEALAAEFGAASGGVPTEGEVAREAIRLAASDPEEAAKLKALASGPTSRAMLGVVGGIALVTAALLVLGTHVKFERRPDGTWSLKIEKKPTKDALLKPLVQKILGLIGLGN